MATIITVSGINTPNEGRVIWNNNFVAINTELEQISTTIGAVGGDIVGTTETQILENKTLSSSFRGGNNTLMISRRDLESTAFMLVTSDSGSVANMDVSAASQYSLQILGSDSITTSVVSNVLYIQNKEVCIMNETNQVLGVKVASVTGGNVAEFGGNVIIDNYLAVGAGHSTAANAEVHLKDVSPELRIETTGTEGYLSFRDGTSNFTWTADLNSELLELRFDGTRIVNFRDDTTTLDTDITLAKIGGAHLIVGDLDVQGTLTAGGLVATATDVVIPYGPVTISGGTSYIADGAIEHDKLVTISGGYILMGNASNVATSTAITGDVTFSSTGVTTIGSDRVTLAMLKGSTLLDNKILATNGSTVMAAGNSASSDLTFVRSGTDLLFTIKSDIIDNANIYSNAAIDMSKTAFAVNISGIVMNGNTLELAPSVKSDILYRDVPVGTIISYAGDAAVLAGSVEDEVIPGWLHCNGWTCSLVTYPDLYTTLGSAWGGAGKLPDLRGAFLRGVDINRGLDPDYASRTGGGTSVKVGSSQADEFEAHTHTFTDNYYPLDSHNAAGTGGDPAVRPVTSTLYGAADTTSSEGGSETRPVNYAVIYLIKY